MTITLKCPHCRALTSVLPMPVRPREERRELHNCDECDGEIEVTVRARYRLEVRRCGEDVDRTRD